MKLQKSFVIWIHFKAADPRNFIFFNRIGPISLLNLDALFGSKSFGFVTERCNVITPCGLASLSPQRSSHANRGGGVVGERLGLARKWVLQDANEV
jgi:hypothetical protein